MGAPRSHQTRGPSGGPIGPAAEPRSRRPDRDRPGRPAADRMLRIIHTADVHLGARHDDLGEQAAAQRERQFAAFKATVDLALAEKVDLFLIAGDLFDSNVQPRRSVERVAAELKRLVDGADPDRHHPGHPRRLRPRVDLPRLRPRRPWPAAPPDDDLVTVLDPGPPVGPPRRARRRRPRPGLRDEAGPAQPAPGPRRRGRRRPAPRGRSGWSTARSRSPARPTATRSSSRPRRSPPAASTTSRSATGTRRSRAKAGAVTYAYSGAPEPVALDQDRAGKVLLVELDEAGRQADRSRSRSARSAGRASSSVEVDAADGRQPAGARRRASPSAADPDLVLDVRLVGVRPDELDLDIDEIEARAARRRSSRSASATRSVPALTEGALPVAGHDRRRVHPRPRGADRRARGRRRRPTRPPSCATPSGSAGCCSPATRSRCEDPPAPAAATSGATATLDIDLAPGLTVVRGPNEAGKTTIQRAIELALTRRVDERRRRPRGAPAVGRRRRTPGRSSPSSSSRTTRTAHEDRARSRRRSRGAKGTVRLDYDGEAITDPTLADQVLAELTGIPTEAFFRSTASVRHHELERPRARRGRPARPAPGVDQRRRPRARAGPSKKLEKALHDLTTKGDKNPGRLKVAEAGGRAGRRPRVEQGELALAQLERDRDALSARPRAPGRGRDRPGRAPRAAREGPPGRAADRRARRRPGALRALPPGGRGRRRSSPASRRRHPSPNPLPVVRAGGRAAARRSTAGSASCRRRWPARSRSTSRSRPEPTWRPLSRVVDRARRHRPRSSRPRRSSLERARHRRPRDRPVGRRRGHRRRSALVARRRRAAGCAAATRCRPQLRDVEIDRRLRGRSEMEAELGQAEAETAQQLGALGLAGPRRRPRTCSRARRRTSPRSTG